MPAAQNYKNHERWDPAWHFFMVPMLMINIAFAAFKLVHDWHLKSNHHYMFGWWLIMSIVFFMALHEGPHVPAEGAGPHHPAGRAAAACRHCSARRSWPPARR